ncbi:MAG: right-handed parallel beta-helix repeat-containing protein [Actinomycetota bacterium]|nr:right-handed parallel beta-helix repeat-containing protein [Actinomycetota bacterium]
MAVIGRPAAADTFGPTGPAGVSYPVPSGAVVVATWGSDANAGTASAPLRTIAAAVGRAAAGSTIVIRGGTYRETLGTISKRLVYQPYPGEAVSLRGSAVVSGWVSDGSIWRRDNWTAEHCQSCYPWNAIDPAYPLAGKPDMVFRDGTPLRQVGTRSEVSAGEFFVDYAGDKLYIGSDPGGRLMEASVHEKAMQFNGFASGSVVRGLSFMHYAPHFNGDRPAMVVANTSSLTFERNSFSRSATSGLSIYGQNAKILDNEFINNGLTGLHGYLAHGTLVEGNRLASNNQEHFVEMGLAASAAGAKFGTTHNLTMRNNIAEGNYGKGLWCDLSCFNTVIVSNLLRGNSKDGISYETSSKGIIASNVAADNGLVGLKISESNSVRAYNNTLTDNFQQIGVYDSARSNSNTYERSLGITWDTRNVVIRNNIFSTSGSAGAVVHTNDSSTPDVTSAAEMIPSMDYNAYYRGSSASPSTLVRWCRKDLAALNFSTLNNFRSTTGRDTHGITYDDQANPYFVDEANGNYSLKAGSPAAGTGEALPADIAAAIGVSGGVAVNRGALRWPTGATPPPTPTSEAAAVYRLVNPGNSDHFYTISVGERDAAISQYGYTYETVGFYAWPSAGSGRIPVYRLYNPATGGHFYTASASERDAAISQYGYTYETVGFYAWPSAESGGTPVYRLVNSTTGDHFYTASVSERDTAISRYGYIYENIAFYAAA